MEAEEAKGIIASFLTGEHAARAELKRAVDTVRSDPEYVEHLRREFGSHDEWVSECDIFLSSLAEFAEMSPERRLRDMPESTEHLEKCDSCRTMYWQVMPLWIAEPSADETVAEKSLAGIISLTLDASGELRQIGFGPPAVVRREMAAAAGAVVLGKTAYDAGQWTEWVFDDPETAAIVRLRISSDPTGDLKVECRVETEEGAPVDPKQVRIEVRDADKDTLYLSGLLSRFRGHLSLPAGSWLIRLVSTFGPQTYSWDIPLQLGGGNDG